MTGPRVVSLVPSTTETLLAWGVDVVACTRFCEQPDLRAVGGTKDPDVDAIVALRPDVVVVNDEENRRPDADALVEAGLVVHSCSPRSVAEVASALDDLAVAVGADPPPELRGRAAGGEGLLDRLEPLGLRAFVPIWWRPLMSLAGDTYGSSVLDALGVVNVLADHPDRYPQVTMAEAVAASPDVVVAPSEPYAFRPAHLAALAEVARVVPVNGQDLFWWGVRTPAALARLHATLAPPT
ncbi:MAG: hypothetical protein KDA97_07385 [Acidimicrobiales bacterium]|nr:hypothetical protein [Acidimicrobiales bacterium]